MNKSYILENFKKALEEKQIKVYYQPVIRTINKSLCSMEALARWEDPVHGLVSPGEFIPVLEESRLITLLDLYMLNEICKEMKEGTDAGYINIPVSMNLSRIDFVECDIFEEVEAAVHKYNIARDMLYLELTESVVMDDPVRLKTQIERFRAAGYQIWMDDFGSAYSSLNVLREYNFDEIKLDMKFLHRFDEKTKSLIRSIISMAKELQIRTLAEGVETQEQYDFLRSIGCEKVQGFLFSRPVPREELLEMYEGREHEIETRLWHKYYSKVGDINFITDRPLSIVDFDGKDFHILYANEEYRKVWEGLGVHGPNKAYEHMNSKSSPEWKKYRESLKHLKVGETQQLEFTAGSNYVRLTSRVLCMEQGHYLFQTEILNLTRMDEEKQNNERKDYIFRMMYAMYDGVYVINPTTKRIEAMIAGENFGYLKERLQFGDRVPNGVDVAKEIIEREDRAEFEAFFETSTLEERINRSGKSYVTEMFRTRSANGAYIWKLHTILVVPGSDVIIYSSRFVPLLQEQIQQKADLLGLNPGEDSDVWNSLRNSRELSLFWKDKERRFQGANTKFMEMFGFSDESEFVGKTDEEMGWHLDEDPFMQDEVDVLTHGKSVMSRVGKCIIRGVVHNILAFKEPVYRNGEIVGLVGSFQSIDELTNYLGIAPLSDYVDPATGLMSAQGVANSALEYMEGWEFRQEKFAVITVVFDSYKRAEKTYGSAVAKKLLSYFGRLISEEGKNRVTAGRVYGGSFVLFARYREKSEVEKIVEVIRTRSEQIHEIDGYDVTIHPTIKLFYAEDTPNLKEMLMAASNGYHVAMSPQKRLDKELSDNQIHLETFANAIPGGIAIFEWSNGKVKINYMSEGLCQTTGHSFEEMKAMMKPETHYGVLEADEPVAQAAFDGLFIEGKEFNTSYRVLHKTGEEVWVKVQGKLISEHNGRKLAMCIYHNLSESSRLYSTIADETLEGMILREVTSKNILYSNAAARRLLTDLKMQDMTEMFHKFMEACGDKGSCKEKFGDRYLAISKLRSTWNGRDVDVCYIMDLTQQHLLSIQSRTDGLTGLKNRHALREEFESLIGTKVTMFMLDVDHFKLFNDQFGHETGDRVLVRCADMIKQFFGDCNCYRYGGDEFLITSTMIPREELQKRINRMQRALQEIDLGEGMPKIQIAYGMLGGAPQTNRELRVLLKSADDLLYRRKQIHHSQMMEEALEAQAMSSGEEEPLPIVKCVRDGLEKAIEEGQFVVYFQPQYHYRDHALSGAEALVRWKHPQKGMISPAEFIPYLESNGMISVLDEFVLRETCKQQQKWKREGLKTVPISVNLSRRDLETEAICYRVRDVVNEYGLSTRDINLEVTESAYMEQPESVIEVVSIFQKLGFQVEMDDFGSGYSSLNSLKDIPVDILKLDMRFVSDASISKRSGKILSAVIRMAHWLGIPVIAEGVETEEQAGFLSEIGCFYMQGYYFDRALPAEEFEDRVRNARPNLQKDNRLTMKSGAAVDYFSMDGPGATLLNNCLGPAAIIEYDGKDVELVRSNEAMYEMFGISKHEQLNHSFRKVFYEENADAYLEAIHRVVENMDQSECEIRTVSLKDPNTPFWTRTKFRYLRGYDGIYALLITVENIDKERRMEQVNSQLFMTMDLLEKSGAFGSALMESGEPSRITYFNPILPAFFGYSPEEFKEITGRDAYALIAEEDRSYLEKMVKQAFQKPIEMLQCRIRHVCKDGSLLPGTLIGIVVQKYDGPSVIRLIYVPENHAGQKELLNSVLPKPQQKDDAPKKRNYRSVPEEILDAYVHCSINGLRIIDSNPAFCKMVGYEDHDLDTVLYNSLPMYLEQEDGKRMEEALHELHGSEGCKKTLEVRLHTCEGKEKWALATIHKVGQDVRYREFYVTFEVMKKSRYEEEFQSYLYRNLEQNEKAGIALFRIYGKRWNISHVSEGYLNMLDYTWEQLHDLTENDVLALVHPEEREKVRAMATEYLQERKGYILHFRMLNAKGEYVWIFSYNSFLEYKGEVYLEMVNFDVHQMAQIDELKGFCMFPNEKP